MIHKIISTMGLGVLGIDPITAIFILSMELRKDKKIKITSFFLSFTLFSILFGAIISSIFGASVFDFINSLIPADDSQIWLFIEIGILIIIVLWVFKRIFIKTSEKKKDKQQISGGIIKYITTGFVFALTCFTDPTYYAVIVLGSETKNFLIITLLIAIWFFVSQFMTIIAYMSIEFNFINRLTDIIERFKNKYQRIFSICFNVILIIIALLLLVDLLFYLCLGKYLF